MIKRFVLFTLIAALSALFAFFTFTTLKTRHVVNDYFDQGRWQKMQEEYGSWKKDGYTSLFYGDSMTENFKPYMRHTDSLVNMGISGDFSSGLVKRIDNVLHFDPDNVFIMIGINDIVEKVPLSSIYDNYSKVIELIMENCPETTIYIQSTLPTRGLQGTISSSKDINVRVGKLNAHLRTVAREKRIVFIDLVPDFADEQHELRKELTTDGIHLNDTGYLLWKTRIEEYVDWH